MGLFGIGGDSKSSATNVQTTLSSGGDLSPNIGRDLTGAAALAANSLAIKAGNLSPTNANGQQIIAGSKSSINLLDGGAIPAITQIAQQALDLAGKNNDSTQSTLKDFLTTAADQASASLADNQMLAANAATGGASTASATITKILMGAGVFILVGLALYFFRKK